MRNARANFSAECIDIEFQSNALFADARQVSRDGLKVEAARQTQPCEGEAIALPTGRTAQARKSLAKPRRCNHDLVSTEATSFGFTCGQNCASQQNHSWPVFEAQVRAADADVLRKQIVQRRPGALAQCSP